LGIFPFICKRRIGRWFVGWRQGAERGEETGVDEAKGVAGLAFGGGGLSVGDPLEGAGAVGGPLLDWFDQGLIVGGDWKAGNGWGAVGWVGEGRAG